MAIEVNRRYLSALNGAHLVVAAAHRAAILWLGRAIKWFDSVRRRQAMRLP
jgi:hypothetical protein